MRIASLVVVAACYRNIDSPGRSSDWPTPRHRREAPAATGPTQEETLAAIQKAMNDLKSPAQQCWAKIATERFDIEGEYEAQIEIAEPVAVTTVSETVHDAKLVACMHDVLVAYPWAPPLRGQTIRLPFKWRAPDGQNVIDRTLVGWTGQGKIDVAVLLDENNTGNDAASMLEVGIQTGGSTGMRRADRAELWWFQSWKPDEFNELDVVVGKEHAVAGDMMFVPAGGARDVQVRAGTLRAVVVIVPGGREGVARGGALPTAEGTGTAPVIVHAASVKQTGIAKIFVDATVVKHAPLAASILHFPADANVAEHVHAHETELLYTFSQFGDETVVGTLTVNGVAQEVTDHAVIQIPAGARHSYVAKTESFALQIYTPAGPEQRFVK